MPTIHPCSRRVGLRGIAIGLAYWGLQSMVHASAGMAKPVAPKLPSTGLDATSLGLHSTGLPDWRFLGHARLSVWGFDIYDASLWAHTSFAVERSAQLSQLARMSFVLELTYLRNFSVKDIASRSLKEMQSQSPIEAERAERWQATLMRAFAADGSAEIKKGDRIAGWHLATGAGSIDGRAELVLTKNNRLLAHVREPDLPSRFMAVWLGLPSAAPKLRLQLLGLA